MSFLPILRVILAHESATSHLDGMHFTIQVSTLYKGMNGEDLELIHVAEGKIEASLSRGFPPLST
jgi:hypothetical protein